MNWFRFYHDALENPKVQALRPELFKHWVNLLCLASKGKQRGRLPAPSAVAFALRVSVGKSEIVLRELETAGLLDLEGGSVYVMHDWDERQPISDSGAARQQAFRDRHRNGQRNVTRNVTDNVTVTPRAREDGDGDGDSEKPPTPLPGGEGDGFPVGEESKTPATTPSSRPPADAADVERAVEILCSDLRTEPVGIKLGREHNGRQMLAITGWQWVIAAERLQGESVPDGKRDSFPYFVGIARNVRESDRTGRERKPPRKAENPDEFVFPKAGPVNPDSPLLKNKPRRNDANGDPR